MCAGLVRVLLQPPLLSAQPLGWDRAVTRARLARQVDAAQVGRGREGEQAGRTERVHGNRAGDGQSHQGSSATEIHLSVAQWDRLPGHGGPALPAPPAARAPVPALVRPAPALVSRPDTVLFTLPSRIYSACPACRCSACPGPR